jgi:hypothetical protein
LTALSWLFLAASERAICAPPIEAYGNLPQVELMRVSRSGARVAMIGVAGDKRQLVVVAIEGNHLLKAAAIGDNKVRDLDWVGDDDVLVSVSATADLRLDFGGRFELAGVIHVGLNDKPPWAVFQNDDTIEHSVEGYFGAAKLEGRWYGYFGGITRQRARGSGATGYLREHVFSDLYRVDLNTGKAVLQVKGSERNPDWVLSADGTVLAYSDYAQATGEWLLYGAAHGNTVLLKKTSPTHDINLVGPGRTAGTVLLVDQSGDMDQIREINVTNGQSQELLASHRIVRYQKASSKNIIRRNEPVDIDIKNADTSALTITL